MRIDGGSPLIAQGNARTLYRAIEGETLASVAKNFQLAAQSLAKVNSLPLDAVLKAGQELIIPEMKSQPAGSAGISEFDDALETFDSKAAEGRGYIGPEVSNYVPNLTGGQGDINSYEPDQRGIQVDIGSEVRPYEPDLTPLEQKVRTSTEKK